MILSLTYFFDEERENKIYEIGIGFFLSLTISFVFNILRRYNLC